MLGHVHAVPGRLSSATNPEHTEEPLAGTKEITLRPSAMDALRLYIKLGSQLRQPLAPGLSDAVRQAQRGAEDNRWHLHLTEPQAEGVRRLRVVA